MPPRVPAMRYHSRLSMKRRPHPFSDNLGCGTPIGHRIPEASNITIAIVKLMATVPRGRDWARRAKGWFLEFRLIPVLLWSYTAGVAGVTAWLFLVRAPWLSRLIVGGYALGLAYTVPPFATSYRPLAGEWLGGFPGVLLSGLGAYTIQTLSLSPVVVLALSA